MSVLRNVDKRIIMKFIVWTICPVPGLVCCDIILFGSFLRASSQIFIKCKQNELIKQIWLCFAIPSENFERQNYDWLNLQAATGTGLEQCFLAAWAWSYTGPSVWSGASPSSTQTWAASPPSGPPSSSCSPMWFTLVFLRSVRKIYFKMSIIMCASLLKYFPEGFMQTKI